MSLHITGRAKALPVPESISAHFVWFHTHFWPNVPFVTCASSTLGLSAPPLWGAPTSQPALPTAKHTQYHTDLQ